MNKKLLYILSLLIIIHEINYSQEWAWAQDQNSSNKVIPKNIQKDASNNIYVLYQYTGLVDLGQYSVNSVDNSQDGCIVKYNSDGNILWYKSFGGDQKDLIKDIATDENGNSYVTGTFKDSIYFDSEYLYTSGEDAFLVKYLNDGSVDWAKTIAWGPNYERPTKISIDINGNLYITGFYKESSYFDSDTINSNGGIDNFIAKYDDSGNFQWVINSLGTNDQARFFGTDAYSDVCLFAGGYFTDSLFYDNDTLVSKGSQDIILTKISSNGNIDWTRQIGGDGEDRCNSIGSDESGNAYLTGFLSTTADFDSTGTGIFDGSTLTSTGATDILLTKYNAEGRLLWKVNNGDIGEDRGYGVSVFENLVQFSGYFSGVVIFNNDTINTGSINNDDTGFGIYDIYGNPLTANGLGNGSSERGQGIVYDNSGGNTFVTGYFFSDTIFVGNDTLINTSGVENGFLAKYSSPFSAAFTQSSNISCKGGSDGSLVVTPYFGTDPYSYNWNHDGGLNDSTATGLSAGTYSVTITDNNSKTANTQITLTEPDTIAISDSIVDTKCKNDNNGEIYITVSGGESPYNYNWSTINGSGAKASEEDQDTLTAGMYYLTVTDNNSCVFADSFVVSEPDSLIGSIVGTDVSENGKKDGSADLSVAGGTSPYSYIWSNDSTTQDIDSLNGGNYYVTITDTNSCTANAGVLIKEPGVFSISLSGTNVKCFGDSTGSIDLDTSGGVQPYTYLWSNGATTQDLDSVKAGWHYVTVTDDNSVERYDSIYISQPSSALGSSITGSDVDCNGGSNGVADLSASGGTLPYSYSWAHGPTTEDVSGLSANTYTVTVTDNKGCTSTSQIIIDEPAAINLSYIASNVSCRGGSDGSIDLTVTGGITPYSYYWSNTLTTEDINNISANTYYVTVTDSNSCTKTGNKEITEPATSISASITQTQFLACYGDSNAVAVANASGGTGTLYYLWSNSQTTQTATNLKAGNLYLTVTDDNSCTKNTSINITQPDSITIIGNPTDVTCNGLNNGYITLTVSGGTPTYSYWWSNLQNTKDITSLSPNTYSVTVTDGASCTNEKSYVISEPLSLEIPHSETMVSCNGFSDGSIDITPTGGTSPYSFNWSNGESTEDVSGLTASSYTITITDDNSCTTDSTINITQPQSMVIAHIETMVTCNGGNDGSIDITPSGGTSPYNFNWSNGESTEDISGLTASSYTITVTDDNSCTADSTINITQPQPMAIGHSESMVSCYNADDGIINISPSGGTQPYSYSWNTGDTTQNLSNLPASTYNVTITDANNCTTDTNFIITQPDSIGISHIDTMVTCYGDSNGAIDIIVSGGSLPYSYSWSNGDTTQDITNIPAETYIITITDGDDCNNSDTIIITQPDSINVAYNASMESCYGLNDGAIDLSPTGGSQPYTYSWSHGPTSEDLSGLAPSIYSVTVSDTNNCNGYNTITITQADSISIEISSTMVNCKDGNDGAIDITMHGGTLPFTYLWDSGHTTEDISNIAAGTYSITATDSNGCIIDSLAVVTEPDSLLLSYTDTMESCYGSYDGAIDITPGGGILPYIYMWDNGDTTQDLSEITAGDYTVTVTDFNSCTLEQQFTITSPTKILIGHSSTMVNCYGGNEGEIDITVIGGSPPFSYSWDTGDTTEDISNLIAGVYTISVTDTNNCIYEYSDTITEPDSIIINHSDTMVSCYNGSDGKIVLNVSGGVSPYTYTWEHGPATQSISNLSTGSYLVTVKDKNKCSIISDTILISQPDSLVINVIKNNDVTCIGDADGKLTVIPTGGTFPFTYSINNGINYQDTNVFEGLASADYQILVVDSNNCSNTSENITIEQPDSIKVLTDSSKNIVCFGESNGIIELDITGGNGVLYYSIDKGLNYKDTAYFDTLSEGSYIIYVKDDKNCIDSSITIEIEQPDELTITMDSVINNDCYGEENGEIIINAAGGIGNLSYSIDGEITFQPTGEFSNLSPNDYTVILKDSNNCKTSSQEYTISEANEIVLTEQNSSDIQCYGERNGEITIAAEGGTGSLLYSINNGLTYQGSGTFESLGEGNYIVAIKDDNQCIKNVDTIEIINPGPLVVDEDSSMNQSLELQAGSVQIIITGGTEPYYYSIDGGGIYHDNNGLFEGLSIKSNYTLHVIDDNNCSVEGGANLIKELTNNVGIDDKNYIDIIIPTYMSLNGDGINDYWNILNIEEYENCQVEVYSLYGKLIYSSKGYYHPWDGYLNGQRVPQGIYIFNIYATDKWQYTGKLKIVY